MKKLNHVVTSIGCVLQFLNQVESEHPDAEITLELCNAPINPYEAMGLRDLLEGYKHLNLKPRISMGCSIFSLMVASAFEKEELRIARSTAFLFIKPSFGMFGSYTEIKIQENELEEVLDNAIGVVATFLGMDDGEVKDAFRDGMLMGPKEWSKYGLRVLGEG